MAKRKRGGSFLLCHSVNGYLNGRIGKQTKKKKRKRIRRGRTKKKKSKKKGKKRKKETKRKRVRRKQKEKGKERRKEKGKGKERREREREDFPALRRSRLDGPSTKVGTHNAIYVWTPKNLEFRQTP